jgi:hypothetical protein
MKPFLLSRLAVCILPFIGSSVAASEFVAPTFSQMNHGGVGLIQTPTARFNSEGEFAVNYQDSEEYRFWSVSLTLFPWMESTMRYADIRTKLYSDDPGFSGKQTLKDKGIDVKFRLWQESAYIPQLAVGFRDFGGTGLFESEFIALSKRWQNVDMHLGLGFGYLGTSGNIANPFCKVSDAFCDRSTTTLGKGGQVSYNKFFKGPAALYGGVEYQTPWQPLRLKLEYDSNNYIKDKAGTLLQDSRFNVAAVYRATDNLDLNLNYQRGNTVGFGLNYRLNFDTVTQVKVAPPPRIVPEQLPAADTQVDRVVIYQQLATQVGFTVINYQLQADEVVIEGYSVAFRRRAEFLERMGRLLAAELPSTVKRYRIREMSDSLPMVETVIDAEKFVQFARRDELDATLAQSVQRIEPAPVEKDWQLVTDNKGFYSQVDTYWVQSFGNPETFYLYQFGLVPGVGYAFNDNFSFNSALRVPVLTNFDEFKFTVDSQPSSLPRVRTYVREYVEGSRIAVENFYLMGKNQLVKDWYGMAYGGLLESMFSGVGGEVLYRPVDSRLAIGVDINYVAQRDFDDAFAVRDYRVATGHVTAYWNPEMFDDVLMKVSVGRYLAKDKGVTVEFAKRFDSGIVVGAYAAKTNVSAAEYGEGSFTKGFYLNFPFDLFTIRPATGWASIPWSPITRDGGQPLARPSSLYNLTEVRSPFVK